MDFAAFNATSRLFTFRNIVTEGVNACINGDCSLPGETVVVNGGCQSSVSVFTVDYDAPNCAGSANVRPLLQPLVGYLNGTNGTNSTTVSSTHRIGDQEHISSGG